MATTADAFFKRHPSRLQSNITEQRHRQGFKYHGGRHTEAITYDAHTRRHVHGAGSRRHGCGRRSL